MQGRCNTCKETKRLVVFEGNYGYASDNPSKKMCTDCYSSEVIHKRSDVTPYAGMTGTKKKQSPYSMDDLLADIDRLMLRKPRRRRRKNDD